ncbi:MAG: peptidoglycan DD-metalloendopeptidase family protein [Rhizobiaceae bacterium]
MGNIARNVVDTILGEAVSGSRSARWEDMLAIASTIANRAAATGVSMENIVSAPNQYAAFGRGLPPGVERYRDLAIAALEHVQTKGPVTSAQYYSTPSASRNLPSGLTPVAQTKGHQFFEDPAARPVMTAVGVKQPGKVAYDIELDTPAPRASILDDVFGHRQAEPQARPGILDDVFGPRAGTAAATVGTGLALGVLDDGPTAEWDGTFSNPLGSITDRATDEFGMRDAPATSLGVGSTNHAGIDLSAERGQTGYPAEAAGPGTVISAQPMGGYGLQVTIEHPNGFTSRYGHLQDVNVAVGDEVAKGTPVGTVGQSGNVSGPHLHFEMRDPSGQPVNPRDVVDMSARDTVTPSPRGMSPTEQRNTAAAYSGLAASLASAGVSGVGRGAPASTGLPAGFDTARFAGDVQPSRAAGAPSAASSQLAAFGSAQPSPSPSPSAQAAMPSAERFGYAAATKPTTDAAPAMAAAQKAGRLSSAVTPSNATPMASRSMDLTAGLTSFDLTGLPTKNARTTAVAPSSMGLLPSTSKAPAGPFSSFNAMPLDLNAMTDMKNTMKAQPLSLPNMPAIPTQVAASTITPPVSVAPVSRVAPPSVSPLSTASTRSAPTPTPRPSFSATDVYSGNAPVGYQAPTSGGNLVSRDQFGNTSVTNGYGVTTVTDPSGRQMGNLGGLGGLGGFSNVSKGIADRLGKAPPGMVGSFIGGAIAGMPGAIVGGLIGSKLGGKTGNAKGGQKSGGLGGLGGFLSGLFGGGGGGSSSGGGSGGRGGSSSGGRASPGADRSQAGNQ